MKNSNVKVFTAFTYLLLLILIVGSVIFLLVQRIQLTNQARTYARQIVERVSTSYMESGSFTTSNFTNAIKQTMQNFGEQIKVITIVDKQGILQNRFRFDSIDPTDDPNPDWQTELHYKYNPILYEQQSYMLNLPGQAQADIQILYQQLPLQLVKVVLLFDTIVISALLLLSFLAFLIIPKRDPAETAWALQSVANQEEMYHEEEDVENTEETEEPEASESWLSQDLSEASWEEEDTKGLEDIGSNDEFGQILGSDDFTDNIAHIESLPSETDPWSDSGSDSETEARQDDNEIALSFNDTGAESQPVDNQESEFDQLFVEDRELAEPDRGSSEPPNSFASITTRPPSGQQRDTGNIGEGSDELFDDLDEGLGDDEPEPMDQELGADIFSQIADAAVNPASREIEEREETTGIPFFYEEHARQGAIHWLQNFLADQKSTVENADNTTPDLSAALLEVPDDDIEIIHASFEQDLTLEAFVLPHDKGLTVFLPCAKIHEGIEQLQDSAARLPASYLKNLKMGITGISAQRSDVEPELVLQEMEYALSNCDDENNISIFDANDQVFHQQQQNRS